MTNAFSSAAMVYISLLLLDIVLEPEADFLPLKKELCLVEPELIVEFSSSFFSSHVLMISRVLRICCLDLYASKIGKKMVTACITMMPGASLSDHQYAKGNIVIA